ncbi:MAG: 3-oxoacyl-ACP synthase [Raineya sp.]|jgi:hypothetical protein|nr:3-oxoacyl-ACP synthase [Raineya sp.]
MIITKEILVGKCLEILKNKKSILEKNIELAQEASRDDTKSSAGDKYETTRAMMQIEIDSNKKRLLETQALENILLNIDINTTYTKISLGSMVITNQGIFFISIGLGQIKLENDTFFIISPDSPIGKELINKQTGNTFAFNQKNYIIEKIF